MQSLQRGCDYTTMLFLQALALEKLLVVVSALPLTPAPPARPRLADLPSVNENPPPPDMAASSAAQTPQPTAANGPLANGGATECCCDGSMFSAWPALGCWWPAAVSQNEA